MKIKYGIMFILSFFCLIFTVNAAPSYNVSAPGSVEQGKKFTVTVNAKNTSGWVVRIIPSGATDCKTAEYSGNTENGENTTKNFSITCRGTSTGIIGFTISGNISDSSYQTVNLSKQVRVSVVEPRKASTNNALKSLSVEGYEITPSFDSEVLEYSVSVASTVNSVKINATKQDNYASVEGLGEKEVIEGANKFEIKVTAENGNVRTYNLVVNVIDENPITIKDGMTVVKNSKYVEIPEGYVEEKITVNGVEVPAFRNEFLNIVLIAVRDKDGNSYFYEVKDGDYYKFVNLSGVNVILYPQDKEINIKGFTQTNITINGNTISAYKYKDLDNYYLIYARDLSSNEEHIYMYDFKNNTYQIFNEELFNMIVKDREMFMYIACASLGVIFLCLIIIIALSKSKKKKVKKSDKNDDVKEELIKEVEEEIKDNKKKKKNKKEDLEDLIEDL